MKMRTLVHILMALVVAVAAVLTIGTGRVMPVHADTLGYPWPTDTEAPCMFGTAGGPSCVNPADRTNQYYWYDWGVYDANHAFHQYRNGYEYRNCTDYVQWKESTIGVSVPANWGNGGQWYGKAPASEQSTTPKAWDAAVVPGAVGHVAFVESVNPDGTITVSEYNHDTQGHGDTRTGTASSMGFTKFVDFGVHPSGGGGSGGGSSWPGVGNATYLGSDHLSVGQTLSGNQYILSTNVEDVLIMQSDGNLVAYDGAAYWSSGTGGHPGAYLVMQSDGNIVVYASGGNPLWWTGTSGQSLGNLFMQNDGNVVAYNTGGSPIWWTGTSGKPQNTYLGSDHLSVGQTMTGGQYVRSSDNRHALLMQGDGNVVAFGPGYHVCWYSGTASPGAYLVMQSDGNIVIYPPGGSPLWWTGTGGQSLANLFMQNDGNVVAYNTGGSPIWWTGTSGCL